jgi:hypothetical protein
MMACPGHNGGHHHKNYLQSGSLNFPVQDPVKFIRQCFQACMHFIWLQGSLAARSEDRNLRRAHSEGITTDGVQDAGSVS